jgi:hypothetical protein
LKPKKKPAVKVFFLFFSMLACTVMFIPGYSPATATVNDPSVEGGDCVGCHGQEQVLPPGHPETKGQKISECRGCHDEPDLSLVGKMTSGHVHNLAGIACTDCHVDGEFSAPVDKDLCLACHGSPEDIARLTADQDPNPHDSIHYGPDLDCDLCHHIHRKSENFCNQCHEFEFMVP